MWMQFKYMSWIGLKSINEKIIRTIGQDDKECVVGKRASLRMNDVRAHDAAKGIATVENVKNVVDGERDPKFISVQLCDALPNQPWLWIPRASPRISNSRPVSDGFYISQSRGERPIKQPCGPWAILPHFLVPDSSEVLR